MSSVMQEFIDLWERGLISDDELVETGLEFGIDVIIQD